MGDSPVQFPVNLSVAGVNAAVPYHFIILFGDVADKAFYEFHDGDCFFHVRIIFMAVVMEADKLAIIFINPGGSNDRAAKIASDILHNGFRVT